MMKMLYPYPGNFMLAWFEPWKTANMVGGAITIAHKAVIDDAFKILLPLRMLAVDLVKRGELPMWNPYQGAGTPLAAVMHPGFFNPFGIVFFFLPVHWAWTVFVYMQYVVLGAATYHCARTLRMSKISSLFTTVILLFSGFVTVRLEYTEFLYGYAGLPLLLMLIEKVKRRSQPWHALAIAAVIAFVLVAGQPFMAFWVFLLAALYAFVRLGFTKTIWAVAWSVVLGIGMAAIQLVPTIELYLNSPMRDAASSSFLVHRFLVPWWHLITIAIPNFFGNHATYNYFGPGGDSIETTAFVGVIPVAFALYFIFQRKVTVPQKYFMGLLVASIALAVDWWGSRAFHTLPIPIISTEAPSRLFAFSTLAIAFLAGWGMDAISKKVKGKSERWKIVKTFIGFCVLVLCVAFGSAFVHYSRTSACLSSVPTCRIVPIRTTILEAVWVVVAIMGALMGALTRKRVGYLIIIGAVIGAGVYNAYKFLPFSPATSFFPQTDLMTRLQNQPEREMYRVMSFEHPSHSNSRILPNVLTAYRVADPNYYNPLYIKRYGQLVAFANYQNMDEPLARSDIQIHYDGLAPGMNFRRQRLLDMISARDGVVKKDATFEIHESTVLPRIYTVGMYQVIRDDKAMLEELFSETFDPYQSVLLEEDPGFVAATSSAIRTNVTIDEQRLLVSVETLKDTLLVVTDAYYPGWNAYIDGKRAKVLRANFALRAVHVPPGTHEVIVVYEPMSWKIGIAISFASLVLLVITYMVQRRSERFDRR